MKRALFLFTLLWFIAVIVGDIKWLTTDLGAGFSWLCLGFAAILIFFSKAFSDMGKMATKSWYPPAVWTLLSNSTSLPGRLEPRDWPPFVYAFAGYGFLVFGSFPLLNEVVVRFILKSDSTH